MYRFILLLVCLSSLQTFAQNKNGIIRGRVKDAINNEGIPLASVILQNTTNRIKADLDGKFEFSKLTPGLYNIEVSYVGYSKKVFYEIAVDNSKPTFVEILLEKNQLFVEILVFKHEPASIPPQHALLTCCSFVFSAEQHSFASLLLVLFD